MIITKIYGGLGNQLFQYATGRAISKHFNTELALDITSFETYNLHKYGLDNFNINQKIASKNEIAKYIDNSILGKIVRKISHLSSRKYYHEKTILYDKNVFLTSGNIYIDGYWQSEKYFLSIKDILLQELIAKNILSGENEKIADQIKNSQSISLHIRRGDYVSNLITNQKHGTCGLDYYEAAIQFIITKANHPHFFVFSDDPSWVIENLKINHPTTYINHNGVENNFEDIRLMSLCNHNIIANSTFSWWGAWLNKNENKIIIAPKKWFNENKKNNPNSADIIPESWIRM